MESKNPILEALGPIESNLDVIASVKLIIQIAKGMGMTEIPMKLEALEKVIEIMEYAEMCKEMLNERSKD